MDYPVRLEYESLRLRLHPLTAFLSYRKDGRVKDRYPHDAKVYHGRQYLAKYGTSLRKRKAGKVMKADVVRDKLCHDIGVEVEGYKSDPPLPRCRILINYPTNLSALYSVSLLAMPDDKSDELWRHLSVYRWRRQMGRVTMEKAKRWFREVGYELVVGSEGQDLAE